MATQNKLADIKSIPLKHKNDIRRLPYKTLHNGFRKTRYISLDIVILEKNGYINITPFINDKTFNRWISNPYTIEQLEMISNLVKIPVRDLIIYSLTDIPESDIRGIYVHPKIFYLILIYFSPNFFEKSYDIISNYFVRSQDSDSSSDSDSDSDSDSSSDSSPRSMSRSRVRSVSKPKRKSSGSKSVKSVKPKSVKAKSVKPKSVKPKSVKAKSVKPKAPRKLSAYQQFTKKRIPELRKENPGIKHQDYMKMAAAEWKNQSK